MGARITAFRCVARPVFNALGIDNRALFSLCRNQDHLRQYELGKARSAEDKVERQKWPKEALDEYGRSLFGEQKEKRGEKKRRRGKWVKVSGRQPVVSMLRQETRKGTQGLEEIDTYEMLDKLKPEKCERCKRGKSVGSACLVTNKTFTIGLDPRIGVALSRARDYVAGRHQREAEVKQATAEVLLTAREMERKQQQEKTY